jgi:hypothetical protein
MASWAVTIAIAALSVVGYGADRRSRVSVRLEPPVEKLTPKLNRCFWIQPSRTTTYKLVAEGADGTEVAETDHCEVT